MAVIRRSLRWLVLLVIAVAIAGLAGTFVPRPLWRDVASTAVDPQGQRILVLSNPIHTDIALPLTAAVRERFGFLRDAGLPLDHPDARWLVVGWGGRAFYLNTPTWADIKPMPLLKGLSIDRSVMHVEVAGEIAEPQAGVDGHDLSGPAFASMIDAIDGSFQRKDGAPMIIDGFSYRGDDRFFEANGSFTAIMGCNTWTAQMLRQGGLRTGLWNPLPRSLTLSLRMFN